MKLKAFFNLTTLFLFLALSAQAKSFIMEPFPGDLSFPEDISIEKRGENTYLTDSTLDLNLKIDTSNRESIEKTLSLALKSGSLVSVAPIVALIQIPVIKIEAGRIKFKTVKNEAVWPLKYSDHFNSYHVRIETKDDETFIGLTCLGCKKEEAQEIVYESYRQIKDLPQDHLVEINLFDEGSFLLNPYPEYDIRNPYAVGCLDKFEAENGLVFAGVFLYERTCFSKKDTPEIIRSLPFGLYEAGMEEWFRTEILGQIPDWEIQMFRVYKTFARKIMRAIDEKVMVEIDLQPQYHPSKIQTMIRVTDIPINLDDEEMNNKMRDFDNEVSEFLMEIITHRDK